MEKNSQEKSCNFEQKFSSFDMFAQPIRIRFDDGK